MARLPSKKSPRRSKPSYATSVLMITLLLFVLGMFGMILIHFKELSRLVTEQVEMLVVLRDSGKEVEFIQMQKKLETQTYVKTAEYISKEAALKVWLEQGNEEFGDMVDDNPLPAMIVIHLQAEYVQADSIQGVRDQLAASYAALIREIVIDDKQVEGVTKWPRKALIVLGIVGLLFLVIILVLMDSTVRLSMYSNRFLVKSMQLVGAQRNFITRPYVKRSITYGFFSAVLAIALVVVCILWLQNQLEELRQLENFKLWGLLFLLMIGLGILISWWSTHRAVTKYLRLKLDELY